MPMLFRLLPFGCFAFALFFSSEASASWAMTCGFQVKLLAIKGPITSGKIPAIKKRPVRFQLLEITNEGNYLHLHCKDTMIRRKAYDAALQGDEKQLSSLKEGMYLHVGFKKISDLGEGGEFLTSEDWFFQNRFQPSPLMLERWSRRIFSAETIEKMLTRIEAEAKDGKPQIIHLSETHAGGGLTIDCKIGQRCDSQTFYRAQLSQGSLAFEITLQGRIFRRPHLAGLLKSFNLLRLRMEPLHLDFPGWLVLGNKTGATLTFDRRALGKAVRLTGFAKGRIQGEIRFSLSRLLALHHRHPCPPPRSPSEICRVEAKGPIPLLVKFDLPLRLAPMDCTKGGICKELPLPTSR